VFNISDSLNGDWPPGGLRDFDPNSIMGTAFKASCVAKAGGGVGYYFGDIRPRGAVVKSVHRKACGPVTVLRWLHGLRSLITQGGKRDLAQMGVLPAEHPDIREFIHCKDEDPKALESFNISVSWKNHMLKEIDWDNLERDSHNDTPTGLWWEQVNSAWRTGDPGVLFWDAINRWNATPHLGTIEATNPCGETPNINDEPCNLGSLALRRFLKKAAAGRPWRIDWDLLRHFVRMATRYLDEVLDANVFPHPNITAAAMATRKLGLGVMGWADMLALMHIPYDSNEAVDLAGEVSGVIKADSLEESKELARKKGVYPAWDTAPPEVQRRFPWCRNSTRTSIAPTGTIAILADNSPSIEPHYAIEWERTTHEGIKLQESIAVKDDLGSFRPKIANEIGWEWHVRHQAAWQKNVDLGVSKTVNLPNNATVQDVSKAYRMMWELECKGGTIFRDGCRSEQVLVAKKKSVYTVGEDATTDQRIKATMEAIHAANKVDPEFLKGIAAELGKLIPTGVNVVPKVDEEKLREEIQKYGNGLQKVLVPKATLVERKPPQERNGPTWEAHIGGVSVYLSCNVYPDTGMPCEIFLTVSKGGSTLDAMTDAWAMAISKLLQFGVPLDRIVRLFSDRRGEPSGMTMDPAVPVCTSIHDYVVRRLAAKYITPPPAKANGTLTAAQVANARLRGTGLTSVPHPVPPVVDVTPTPDYPGMIPGGTSPQPSEEELLAYEANMAALVAVDNGFLQPEAGKVDLVHSGQFCPECGRPLYSVGGCLNCVREKDGCGFSRCG
jgi:ribonucleoside-diphosphate reductase alpha chain